MWLIAYEVDEKGIEVHKQPDVPPEFDQVVLARWTFEVKPIPIFATNSATWNPKDNKITKAMKVEYLVDEAHSFPAPSISNKDLFVNALDSDLNVDVDSIIIFKLKVSSSPGKLLVDTETGEMLMLPEKVGAGYTVSLLAVDRRGSVAVVVDEFAFSVVEPPAFKVGVDETGPRKEVGDKFDDYDTITEYVTGENYRISPRQLIESETTVSSGVFKKIKYALNGAPDGWFVGTDNGQITGVFDEPTEVNKPITMTLNAVDEGGQIASVENYTFTVVNPPQFELAKGTKRTRSGTAFTDPAEMQDQPYIVNRNYRIAPIELIKAKTNVSAGDFDNITYTVEGAPDGWFVGTESGEIAGTFAVERNEEIRLYAVDAGNAKVLVETYTFAVEEPKSFEVSVDTDGPRASAGAKYDDPDTPPNREFITGESYRIAPRTLIADETTVSAGFFENITYALSGAPDGWFVGTDSGEITGVFDSVVDGGAVIKMKLNAVDESGATALVEEYTFTVVNPLQFELAKGTTRTRSGPSFTDPAPVNGKARIYAVGDTYLVAPLEVLDTTDFSTADGTVDSLRYALNGTLPDGLFVKTTTGDIQVSFTRNDSGKTYAVHLDVVDGSQRATLETMTMQVKYRDIDDPDNVAAFGPNSTACLHGIPFELEGADEFDGKYTCNCDGTLFEGSNCQTLVQVVECEAGFARINGECQEFKLKVDRTTRKIKDANNAGDYTDPADNSDTVNPFYAIREPYRIAPFEVLNTSKQSDPSGTLADITYAIAGTPRLPDGFFLSTTSGEIFFRFGPQEDAQTFNVTLFAVDKAGARQEVETMTMAVKYKDVDKPEHGPTGKDCRNNKGVVTGIPTDNEVIFDERYTCTCLPGWEGANCDGVANNCDDDEIVLFDGNCTTCFFDSAPDENQTECVVQACSNLEEANVCACNVSALTNAEEGFVNVKCNGNMWPKSGVFLPQTITQLSFSAVEPSRLADLLEEVAVQSDISNILVEQSSFVSDAQLSSSGTALDEPGDTGASASRSIAPLPECAAVVPENFDIKIGVGSICKVGTYSDLSNDGACTSCDRGGYFSDTEGQVGYYSHCACSACQNGTWSPSPGSATRVCDVCPQGTTRASHAQYRACPCLDNWSRRDRFGECVSCDGVLGIECSGDARVLKAGFYWEFPSVEEEQAYMRFTDNLAKSHDYDKSISAFSGSYPIAYACPGGNATCLGFNSASNQSSSCSNGNTGVKCAVCDDDYFQMNGACTACPKNRSASIAVMIIIAVVFIGVIYWIFKRNIQDVPFIGDAKDKIESAFSLVDSNNDGTVSKEELATELKRPGGELVTMLEDAGINTAFFVLEQMDEDDNGNIVLEEFKAALQSSTQRCISCVTYFATNKCKFYDHEQVNFMTMVKIIVSFTQVKSLLVEVYPGAPWPDSYRSATSALQFLSSNPLSVMMPSCLSSSLVITSYSEMIMSSLAPLVLAPLIWIYYLISSRCSADPKQLQAVCISTASFAFYLLYPTITVSAVRVLAKCDTICTDEAETGNCVSYLHTDYSITCGSGGERFSEYSDTHKKYRAIAAVSFVVYAIMVPVAIGWKIRHNKHVRKDDQDKAKAQGTPATEIRMSAFVAGLSFYAAPYRKGFYLWETVDLFRKLLVVSIVVFIADGTSLQLVVGLIFAVGGLVLQLMYKPFKHPSENALAAVSQGIIALALAVGGLLRSNKIEVAAMMATGDVDSFVAGVYMITSGILLYVLAAAIWFGNPLAFLCHPQTKDAKGSENVELSVSAVVTNSDFTAVQETILDNFNTDDSNAGNANDSEYLDIENNGKEESDSDDLEC